MARPALIVLLVSAVVPPVLGNAIVLVRLSRVGAVDTTGEAQKDVGAEAQ